MTIPRAVAVALEVIETWGENGVCEICLSLVTNGEHGQVWSDELEGNVDCPVGELRRSLEIDPVFATSRPVIGEQRSTELRTKLNLPPDAPMDQVIATIENLLKLVELRTAGVEVLVSLAGGAPRPILEIRDGWAHVPDEGPSSNYWVNLRHGEAVLSTRPRPGTDDRSQVSRGSEKAEHLLRRLHDALLSWDQSADNSMTRPLLLAMRDARFFLAAGTAPPEPNGPNEVASCWCYRCLDAPELGLKNPTARKMILCPACGNKRCPRATDHRFACTDSNEAGQFGSLYPEAELKIEAAYLGEAYPDQPEVLQEGDIVVLAKPKNWTQRALVGVITDVMPPSVSNPYQLTWNNGNGGCGFEREALCLVLRPPMTSAGTGFSAGAKRVGRAAEAPEIQQPGGPPDGQGRPRDETGSGPAPLADLIRDRLQKLIGDYETAEDARDYCDYAKGVAVEIVKAMDGHD